ncbi:MAG TPA: hypothetical protein VHM01_24245 [Alphaproteobacteria bacterium]|nr:hypothetical protein [Alphaproteobacteria bacterium]
MADTICRAFDARLARIAADLSKHRSALAQNAVTSAVLRSAMAQPGRTLREAIAKSRRQLGFSSHPHFCTAFHRRTGLSPPAWRAQRRRHDIPLIEVSIRRFL